MFAGKLRLRNCTLLFNKKGSNFLFSRFNLFSTKHSRIEIRRHIIGLVAEWVNHWQPMVVLGRIKSCSLTCSRENLFNSISQLIVTKKLKGKNSARQACAFVFLPIYHYFLCLTSYLFPPSSLQANCTQTSQVFFWFKGKLSLDQSMNFVTF